MSWKKLRLDKDRCVNCLVPRPSQVQNSWLHCCLIWHNDRHNRQKYHVVWTRHQCLLTGADSRAELPVLLYSVLLAWQSYYFVPSCGLSVRVNMAEITRGKRTTMTTRWMQDECDCFYLFSPWPLLLTSVSLTVWGWQFTSVYLDSQAVVVWIWIMNPFRIPFRRCGVPVAMATVHYGSERHLVRYIWPGRLIDGWQIKGENILKCLG